MFQSIRGQGGHFVFCNLPNHSKLVEDVEILLPTSFIEFSSADSEKKSKM